MRTLLLLLWGLTSVAPAKDAINLPVFTPVVFAVAVATPPANPFTDVRYTAKATGPDGKVTNLIGYCDDPTGRIHRIRFCPTLPGDYKIEDSVVVKGQAPVTSKFQYTALPTPMNTPAPQGLLQVHPEHPFHFRTTGNSKPYFWNGTTTYWLAGFTDDAPIHAAIDRLAKLQVNHIRVAINARTTGGERWYEPQVKDTNQFRFELNPWLAREAARQNPAFDTSRYNIEYFRRLERLVEQARTKNVIVSIIFHLDGQDPGVDPFHHLLNYEKATPAEKQAHFAKYPQGDAEEAYYRYVVARLSGFPNIIWDVTNEWHLFRSTDWVRNMAKLIRTADPLPHLISV
ncbi:MAG: DUF5060 domain-containing protein, partial [Gemmataceae bacterium]